MSILQTFFDWQCRAILESGVLLLLVAAIWGIFGRRLSPQWGIALVLLVVFKAVVPVTLPAPESLTRFIPVRQWNLEQQPSPVPVAELQRTETLPQPVFIPPFPVETRFSIESIPVQNEVSPTLSTPQPILDIPPAPKVVEVVPASLGTVSISWPVVFGGVWLAIVAALFGRLTIRQIVFHRQMRQARRIELEELPLLFFTTRGL